MHIINVPGNSDYVRRFVLGDVNSACVKATPGENKQYDIGDNVYINRYHGIKKVLW